MPSDDPVQCLEDIRANIARIRGHVEGMDEEAFLQDAKTQDAVERCIERIAEAARKLGDLFDQDYPGLDLPALRRLGSVLRHDYDGVQPALLWGFVRKRLGPLDAMARAELARGCARYSTNSSSS
ncbi:MAG: DUF86 domain-containing protein [Rhodospirillales bacterium]|nr:DUF86 domain-containing protein [Rhodospirillales bacterium]